MPELATVAGVQAELNDTSLSSATLTPIINAAEEWLARRCNRYDVAGNHWLAASHTQYFEGRLAASVLLDFLPVTAVASATIRTSATGTQTVTLTDLALDGIAIADLSASLPGTVGKLEYRNSTVGLAWFDRGDSPPTSYRRLSRPNFSNTYVTVAYTGGYTTAPPMLVRAAIQLSAVMYRMKSVNPTLKSERLGSYDYTLADSPGSALFASVAEMIAPFRRVTL